MDTLQFSRDVQHIITAASMLGRIRPGSCGIGCRDVTNLLWGRNCVCIVVAVDTLEDWSYVEKLTDRTKSLI